jgi:uncharacterized membrane protein
MDEGIMAWILGPQLIGILLLIIGLLQKQYPPKTINRFYGYRTPAAMVNQQTWDEANRYATHYMIKAGVVLLIIGLLVTVIVKVVTMPAKIYFVISYLSLMAAGMGSGIGVLISTENHLEKVFDKKL